MYVCVAVGGLVVYLGELDVKCDVCLVVNKTVEH